MTNENIRGTGTVKVERLGIKMREGRLRRCGYVMRRDQEYLGRRVMKMELPGKRKRGRPKKRFLDVVNEDIGAISAREKDIKNSTPQPVCHETISGVPQSKCNLSLLFTKYFSSFANMNVILPA